MFAFRVIEHLDVVEDVLSGLFTGFVKPSSDPFMLEQVEEALGDRIVVTISAPAHRMFKVVSPQKCRPVPTGILRALVHCPAGYCAAMSREGVWIKTD